MLTMDHLFIYLVIFSSVALLSALKCDDRYSKTDDYFEFYELKGIENFYEYTARVMDGMFNFPI